MNSSNYRFTLDMQSNQSQVSLPVRLGDTNRRLYILLTNGGAPFIMERGFRAVFSGRKADGKTLSNNCIIENKSTIRYDFTPNTATAPGVVDCEVQVYNPQGELVTSPRFILVVDERVLNDDDVVSESERSALDAIYASETAREEAEEYRTIAEYGRNSDELTRYYSEQARTDAETARVNAETARVNAETLRASEEEKRSQSEFVRKNDENARALAESQRAAASGAVMATFRTITGENKVHYVDSPNDIFAYICENEVSSGDVVIVADSEFDFIYIGTATDAEWEVAVASGKSNSFLNIDEVAWQAGESYVAETPGGYSKLRVTNEKYNLPIGQEELDAHNEAEDAHDLRTKYATKEELETVEQLQSNFADYVTESMATKEELATVESIAKGANQAIYFNGYYEMAAALLRYPKDALQIGQSILIGKMNVPDLWVCNVRDDVVPIDASRVETEALDSFSRGSALWVGRFAILPLETQKVNLTDYATKEELETVESIAKGANQAISFASYETMAIALKSYPKDALQVGQSILIKTLDVPDLWVMSIMGNYSDYIRTDEEILAVFAKGHQIQVGWYALAPLETQKVNLTEYATKEELADGLQEVKTSVTETANAIKGKATGEIVRVNDVSPLEHTIKCRVRSKNLFNDLLDYKLATDASYTYENGTLTVKGQYANKHIPISEGKTYTFSCKSTRTGESGGGIYIRAYTEDLNSYVNLFSAISELSQTATVTVPKGYPVLRISFYGDSGGGPGSSTYTEIMLEEGSEATGYVPYVDATVARVTRYGKNLLDLSRATFSSATYNKNVNGITCNINNSFYSGVRVDYLNDFLLANKGKTLTFSIAEAIDDALITLLIYGTRTSGKTNQEGSTTGEREISFAISDEFTAITGLEVRVNRKTEAFTDTTTVVRNMQVEVRDTASDFEVYKEATTHTPSADGTVEGIKSVAPTMTLFTNKANVVVEIEYNQDINVLNAKLVEALDAILAIQNTLIGGTSQ